MLRVLTEIIDLANTVDPDAEVEGIKTIVSDTGEKLNRVGKGEYRGHSGEVFRSDSPNAP